MRQCLHCLYTDLSGTLFSGNLAFITIVAEASTMVQESISTPSPGNTIETWAMLEWFQAMASTDLRMFWHLSQSLALLFAVILTQHGFAPRHAESRYMAPWLARITDCLAADRNGAALSSGLSHETFAEQGRGCFLRFLHHMGLPILFCAN